MFIKILRILLLLIFGFILARLDLKKNRIPDKITYPLIILGFILSFIEFGISVKLIYAYLIILGTYFFWVVLYHILKLINSSQTIGGGDVKYSMAIASLYPFSSFFIYNIYILKVIFIAFIFLFAMTIIKLISISILNKLPNKFKVVISYSILQTKVTFAPILFLSSIVSLLV